VCVVCCVYYVVLCWVSWAKGQVRRAKLEDTGENKRKVLGDLLYCIRFPLMTMNDVLAHVQKIGVLTNDEMLKLFTFMGAAEGKKPNVAPFQIHDRHGSKTFAGGTLLAEMKHQQALAGFLPKEHQRKNWVLVYKGKKDGMTGTSFHTKIGDKTPSLSVIKSTNGNIFGGFTTQAWSGAAGGYKHDSKAFLFSLVNKLTKKPLRWRASDTTHSISCSPTVGPTFGGGHNIYCAPSFNTNSNYCNCPYNSYTLEDTSVVDSQTLFAGAYNWTMDDIEVYVPKK